MKRDKDIEEQNEQVRDEEEVKDDEIKEAGEDEIVEELADKFLKILNQKIESVEKKIDDVKKGQIYSKEDVKKMDSKVRTEEFVKALLTNDHVKIQPLSEGVAADGGYLVPEEWANTIVENVLDAAVIRPRATVLTISTNKLNLPALASRPKVYWRNELAVKSTTTAEFTELELTPYSLAAIITVSQELAADASIGLPGGIVAYLTRLLSQAIAQEEDRAFMIGNGVGKPTGIDNYTSSIRSVNAGGALSGDHLISCYYALPQGYRNKAVWIMNSRTLAVVRGLKDNQNRYLLQDLANGQPPQILGRPVLEQNDCPSARIYFGDLSYYYIAQREGISMKTTEEATVASYSAFEKDLIHIKVVERVDGELALTDAFSQITNTGVS